MFHVRIYYHSATFSSFFFLHRQIICLLTSCGTDWYLLETKRFGGGVWCSEQALCLSHVASRLRTQSFLSLGRHLPDACERMSVMLIKVHWALGWIPEDLGCESIGSIAEVEEADSQHSVGAWLCACSDQISSCEMNSVDLLHSGESLHVDGETKWF